MASPFGGRAREATARITEVPVMAELLGISPRRLEIGIIDLVLRFDVGGETYTKLPSDS